MRFECNTCSLGSCGAPERDTTCDDYLWLPLDTNNRCSPGEVITICFTGACVAWLRGVDGLVAHGEVDALEWQGLFLFQFICPPRCSHHLLAAGFCSKLRVHAPLGRKYVFVNRSASSMEAGQSPLVGFFHAGLGSNLLSPPFPLAATMFLFVGGGNIADQFCVAIEPNWDLVFRDQKNVP